MGRAANHPQPEGDAGLQEEEVIVKDQLNAEEREILEKFERDELQPATGADHETAIAPQAARNAFKKTRRVNLRVTDSAGGSHGQPGPRPVKGHFRDGRDPRSRR